MPREMGPCLCGDPACPWCGTPTPNGTPEGYEDAVTEGDSGWAVWGEDGCPFCDEKKDEDGEALFALQCPVCDRPGCDVCMPLGRGCPCPDCEDEDGRNWPAGP